MDAPFFSVVITTFERESMVRRCIDSCLTQSFGDFEAIVVDDGSDDETVAALRRDYADRRLRIAAHARNRGISASRRTGAEEARGRWIVMLDSDWELLPGSLERLQAIVSALPDGVRVVRSRLRWDDGRITPAFMPREPIGYEGRIRWVEEEGGWDAGRCIRRDAFERTPYFGDRRGAMETLYELDLARNETTLCVEDVLGLEHDDAANSWLRTTNTAALKPRLLREAPDMLWMAETTLRRHGEALRRWGPGQYMRIQRVACVQAFLLGDRRKGARYAFRLLRRRPWDLYALAALLLGMIGPGAVIWGTIAQRRLAALA